MRTRPFLFAPVAALLLLLVVSGSTPNIARAADVSVVSTGDAGVDTLRGAIAAASAGDTIVFDSSLAGETIALTSTGDTTIGDSAIRIDKNLTIDGTNAPFLEISGNDERRIFYVAPGVTLTLRNITLVDGLAQGVDGENAAASGKGGGGGGGGSAGLGGAVFVDGGTLFVDGVTFIGNAAVGGDGGAGGSGGTDGSGGTGGTGASADGGGGIDGGTGGDAFIVVGGGTATGGNGYHGSVGGFASGGGGGGAGGNAAFLGGDGVATGGDGGDGGNGGFASGGGGGGGGGIANGGDSPEGIGVGGAGGNGGVGGFGGGGGGGGGGGRGTGGGSGTGGAGAIGAQGGAFGGAGVSGNYGSDGLSGSGGSGGGGAGLGGAIFSNGGDVIVHNSTFSENSVSGGSGGGPGESEGSAIFVYNADLRVLHTTIVSDASDRLRAEIYSYSDVLTKIVVEITHSIGSRITFLGPPDTEADIDVYAFGVEIAELGPLADNGGYTLTYLPGENGRAIDAGNAEVCARISNVDQRGVFRPQGDGCDFGAVEALAPIDVVTTVVDQSNYFGGCTLRDAITANLTGAATGLCLPAAGVVRFAPDLTGDPGGTRTIVLDDGQLPPIYDRLTIDGGGTVTLDANSDPADEEGENRHFLVTDSGDLTLTGLTIQNGWESDFGGAIQNRGGRLTITDSILTGNSTQGGGVIYNIGGSSVVSITNSTIAGNAADIAGGALVNFEGSITITSSVLSENSAQYGSAIYNTGTVSITRSTLTGNTATGLGGTIFNDGFGVVQISNSTLSNNHSTGSGGGIHNFLTSTVIVTNSTITGNTAPTGAGIANNPDGTITLSNSIVAGNTGGGNCAGTGTWNGVSDSNLSDDASCPSPLFFPGVADLGPLADNGGPTLTHLPGEGSDAIDAADIAACPASDQRGVIRPQGDACDIGSVEVEAGLLHDLALTKELRTAGARPGDTVRYDLTVTNAGTEGQATDVVLVDDLPDGTTFVSVEAPVGWSCDDAPRNVLTCTTASMPAGSEAFFVVRVQLHDDTRGIVTNEASVSSSSYDLDGADNSASASFTVLTGPPVPQPDLTPTVTPTSTATPTPSETPTATPTPEPGTFTYDLSFRWTLVTWYGVDGISPADALTDEDDILAVVTAFYGWDGDGQNWLGFFPNAVDIPGANDLTALQYGAAYWIAISSEDGATWTVPTGPQFRE